MNQCCHEPKPEANPCCESDKTGLDYWLWVPLVIVVVLYFLHVTLPSFFWITDSLGMAVFELMNTMAIGIVIGVFMVALLSYVPRELVMGALGSGCGFKGICRATAAGVLLDLCSHGILMVGAKLYERGVSTGQVMAFLIASPWNSLSLTVILVALIGLSWTLVFIFASVIIAILAGVVFDLLVARKVLPSNPNAQPLPDGFKFWPALKAELRKVQFHPSAMFRFLKTGLIESKVVIRWLLIGVILAALIRTFVPEESFGTYFGPTALGLLLTMIAATIIEVCSEGATPIAADIFNRAEAPGNSFAFLMAGVSTDYTEIMVLKDTTHSWKIALFLPLVTLPQIIVIAILFNSLS